jgi:ribosomal protein L7/L12
MKRFIVLLVSGGIAWWAWWYTFSVDPGDEGFGFHACSDGEGTCSDDPSVLTLILAIVAGIVAFIALLSVFSLIRRKLKGDPTPGPTVSATTWMNPAASMTSWTQQAGQSLQEGIKTVQSMQGATYSASGYAMPGNPATGNPAAGNPAMVGQAGIIGNPAYGAPAAANPAAASPATGNPAARTPTAADRAASRDRWLKRASGAGPGGAAASATSGVALTGVAAYDPTPTRATGTTGSSRVAQATAAAAAATHPDTTSIVLVAIGPRDLGVQREVRRLTGFGLDDAKKLLATVAKAPQYVAVDLPWDEAQSVKRTFDRMGATVELR